MSWLDKFFTGGYKNIASAGSLLPQETTLNFVSGATVVDNPSTGMTNVTVNATVTPGAAGQGYFTNNSLAAVWATYSQDVTMSATSVGQATVQGILGKSLPSLPVSQSFLSYSGSAWSFAAPALASYGGDLSSTSTATAQYVQSLSFNNLSAGGTIAINGTGTVLQWASGNTAPTINQAQVSGTGSTAGVAMTITAQQGQNVSGGTNNAGGNLVLQSGAPGTGGTGGNAGQVQFYCGSTQVLAIDNTTFAGYTHFTNTGSSNGYYFNNTGANFYVVSSNIFFDGILQIQDPGNGDKVWNFTATYNANAAQTIGTTCTSTSISQDTLTTLNTNGGSFTIQPQFSTNASSTSGRSGVLNVNLGAPPGSSTTETWMSIQRNGTDTLSFGPYPGSSAIGAIWLGSSYAGANSTTSNFAIAGDTVSTYMNAPNSAGQFVFRVTNNNVFFVASPSSTSQLQAAVGQTGGILINQVTPTSDVATAPLVINSQAAFASASSHKNPGTITIDTGTKVAGGTATINIGTSNATAVNIGGSITFSAYGEGALISSSSGVITSQAVPVVSGLYALTYNEGSNTFAWTNTTTFGGGTSTGLTVAFRNLWVTR